MHAYQPGEQPNDDRITKLNTNENPYPPSPRVAQAVEKAAADLNRYPAPLADSLRERAAQRYDLEPEQVLVGNGSDDLLAICLRACVEEGDPVAYAVPTYSLYRTLAAIVGAEATEIPADVRPADGRYDLPPRLFEQRARVKFVCNPNSPYGSGVPIDQLAALAGATSGLVVADEAYVDFGGVSALSLLDDHPNLVVVRTFSKSFSLAGLRLGLAFGASDLVAELAKVKDSYNVSRLAIAAGAAALEDYAWMQANVERVVRTRERVAAAVSALGYVVGPSQTNFLWIDCGARGGEAVYRGLRRRGILVRWFDQPGLCGGIRVTVGTDEEMERFLAGLGAL